MRLITVAGPPSSGKTAVVVKTIECLLAQQLKVGVVKFDCLSTSDDQLYQRLGIPVKVGISGNLCPDHFFVSNIDDCVAWGKRNQFDLLISESAGLCNRCSPHVKGVLAVCVIDNLAGVNTPKKIGPMLKLADIVVITKGDIVSQAEREVFAFKVRQANPRAEVVLVNGITGQGAFDLSVKLQQALVTESLEGNRLRFSMPAAICPYCVGETRIGKDHQRGNVKKMTFEEGVSC
jgi:Ni2+-binding GTPase involved in maturation of urease and hydrogenase